jgi:hypothetical protein
MKERCEVAHVTCPCKCPSCGDGPNDVELRHRSGRSLHNPVCVWVCDRVCLIVSVCVSVCACVRVRTHALMLSQHKSRLTPPQAQCLAHAIYERVCLREVEARVARIVDRHQPPSARPFAVTGTESSKHERCARVRAAQPFEDDRVRLPRAEGHRAISLFCAPRSSKPACAQGEHFVCVRMPACVCARASECMCVSSCPSPT